MVDLLDMTAGRIRFRKPDGTVVLDTNDRMPALLGTLSVTGVTLEWPQTPGEFLEGRVTGGGIERRWNVFASTLNTTVDLGAYPSAASPNIVWARAKLTTVYAAGSISNIDVQKLIFPTGEWVAWVGGSIPISTFGRTGDNPAWLWRSMSLEVASGRWVARLRQGNADRTTAYTTNTSYDTQNTRLELEADFEIGWGVFDL